MPETATDTGVAKAMKFFGKLKGQSLKEFAAEWRALALPDREQLIGGIADGTLNY